MRNKVCLVALGCPKNIVEAESIAGLLKESGWGLTTELAGAKAAIVHTCSFIKDASDESVQVIRTLSGLKEEGKLEKIIVSGCMVQGEGKRLLNEFPLVDGFIGTGSLDKITELLTGRKKFILGSPGGLLESSFPRLLSSDLPTAYLRIAEGCNHQCSFCAIPSLRGKYKSRKISSILEEARQLSANGIKELILIAQDTTNYGKDIYGSFKLPGLLNALSDITALDWIRVMYTYPNSVTDELLETIRTQGKICKYLDLPLQHISDGVLKNMRRPLGAKEVVSRIQARIPDITLRTTFIVGFPGETDRDFKELFDFVAQGPFGQLGVFEYSDNPDIPSHGSGKEIPERIKIERKKELMLLQKSIVLKKNRELKGRAFKILVESVNEHGLNSGRAYFQAPEIDNKIYFSGRADRGSFRDVEITGYKGYDLTGRLKKG